MTVLGDGQAGPKKFGASRVARPSSFSNDGTKNVPCYDTSVFLYVSSAKITEMMVIITNETMYKDTGHGLL